MIPTILCIPTQSEETEANEHLKMQQHQNRPAFAGSSGIEFATVGEKVAAPVGPTETRQGCDENEQQVILGSDM